MLKNDEVELDQNFSFIPDENRRGKKEDWSENFDIYKEAVVISVLKDWNSQDYNYQEGEGWYYKKIVFPENLMNKKYFYLYITGADEEAYVYVNGKLAKEHTEKSEKKSVHEIWNEPFYIDLKKYGAGNTFNVVIRISNDLGNGGLYGGVRLFASDIEL